MIKLASAEGRTFALGQMVVARGDSPVDKRTGRIRSFCRSPSGEFIFARIRVGNTTVRSILQEIEPEPFLAEASDEMARRGLSGELSGADVRAIYRYRSEGRSAVEAGAQRWVDLINR